jgi:outer membrane lipoprotein SlyB
MTDLPNPKKKKGSRASKDIGVPPIPKQTAGAITGAAIGSVAGPVGAVVGGVVGAVAGKVAGTEPLSRTKILQPTRSSKLTVKRASPTKATSKVRRSKAKTRRGRGSRKSPTSQKRRRR